MLKTKTLAAVAAALILATTITGCSAVRHAAEDAASRARQDRKSVV